MKRYIEAFKVMRGFNKYFIVVCFVWSMFLIVAGTFINIVDFQQPIDILMPLGGIIAIMLILHDIKGSDEYDKVKNA